MQSSFSKQYSFMKEIGQTQNTIVMLVQKKNRKKKNQIKEKESDNKSIYNIINK